MTNVGDLRLDWNWVPAQLHRPLHLVCAIRRSTPTVTTLGTGTLVAPRIVVTAAHVADIGQSRVPSGHFWLAPGSRLFADRGLNRSSSLGKYWIEKVYLLAEFPEAGDPDDFAFCVLNRPVMEPAFVRPAIVQDYTFRNTRVPGYPIHDGFGPATGTNLIEGTGLGQVDPGQPHRILYEVDTEGGHSGAPVFFDVGHERYKLFAGIHVADQQMAEADANMGLRFQSQHLAMIDEISHSLGS